MQVAGAPSTNGPRSRVWRIAAFALVLPAVFERPQRGLLLLAALTPFDGLLVLMPGPGFIEGWKEALLGVTLIAALVQRGRAPQAPGGRQMPWWPALLALAVGGTISALVTAGPAGVVAVKITFFWTLSLLVLRYAPFTERDRDALVTTIMVVGSVTAAVGLGQQLVGGEFLVSLGYRYDEEVRFAGGFLRSFSTFNQPFPFALYLVLSLLVGGAVAIAQPRRPRNALFLLVTPVLLAGMATSIVRGAALALGVGVLWLGVLRYRRLLWPVVGAGLLAAVVGYVLLPAGAVSTALSSTSLGERTATWSQVISDILATPLGQGLGATGSAADGIAELTGDIAPQPIPDNYYVKVLVELGPLGLWVFLMVLVTALVWSVRVARRLQGRDAALALGVSASVASVAAASLVATYFEIFPLDYYFWLLLGVVACADAQAGPDQTSQPSTPVEPVATTVSG